MDLLPPPPPPHTPQHATTPATSTPDTEHTHAHHDEEPKERWSIDHATHHARCNRCGYIAKAYADLSTQDMMAEHEAIEAETLSAQSIAYTRRSHARTELLDCEARVRILRELPLTTRELKKWFSSRNVREARAYARHLGLIEETGTSPYVWHASSAASAAAMRHRARRKMSHVFAVTTETNVGTPNPIQSLQPQSGHTGSFNEHFSTAKLDPPPPADEVTT